MNYKFIGTWREIWYAPIQMEWGILQSHFLCCSAKRAWEELGRATGRTKSELIQEGYSVKRLRVKIDNDTTFKEQVR